MSMSDFRPAADLGVFIVVIEKGCSRDGGRNRKLVLGKNEQDMYN